MDNLIDLQFLSEQDRLQFDEWIIFLKKNFKNKNKISLRIEDRIPEFVDHMGRKFKIDFLNDSTNYNKKKLSIKNEILSKALGRGEKGLEVVDLTAGLGVDSIFIAQLGYSVTALERNPLIFAALKIAEKELKAHQDLNVEFHFCDSCEYTSQNKLKNKILYYDPMFPAKKKSALAKQEMEFFKDLVGVDIDSAEFSKKLVESKNYKRLVIKRPLEADPLLKPSGSVKGKIIRYDIYGHE